MVRTYNDKERNIGRFLLLIIILIGVFGIFFFLNSTQNSSLTGNAILSLSPESALGENLRGNFIISLNEGELIPADSSLIVSSGNFTKSFILFDLVSNEPAEGNFYLSSVNIEGNGKGYGKPGKLENDSEVSFTLEITKGDNSNVNVDNSASASVSGNESNDNSKANSVSNETKDNNAGNVIDNSEGNLGGNESNNITNNPIEDVKDNNVKEASVQENSNVTDSSTSGVGITGSAVKETSREIKGKVSKNSPMNYDLESGETVKVVDSSQDIKTEIDGNKLIVTTEYSDVKEGFGKDYFNSDGDKYNLEIDLSKLDFLAEDNNIRISLNYGDKELFSANSNINSVSNNQTGNSNQTGNENSIEINTTESNSTINNSTIVVNATTNITTNVTTNITTNVSVNVTKIVENLSFYDLTENEKTLIKSKTGKEQIDIVKSQIVNDRLVIMYQIGDYWIEKTYDSNIAKDELDIQISIDMAKFAKYLAKTFGTIEENPETVKEYLGNYSIG